MQAIHMWIHMYFTYIWCEFQTSALWWSHVVNVIYIYIHICKAAKFVDATNAGHTNVNKNVFHICVTCVAKREPYDYVWHIHSFHIYMTCISYVNTYVFQIFMMCISNASCMTISYSKVSSEVRLMLVIYMSYICEMNVYVMWTHMCSHTCVNTYVNTCVNTYMNIYMNTYVNTYANTCVNTYVNT